MGVSFLTWQLVDGPFRWDVPGCQSRGEQGGRTRRRGAIGGINQGFLSLSRVMKMIAHLGYFRAMLWQRTGEGG